MNFFYTKNMICFSLRIYNIELDNFYRSAFLSLHIGSLVFASAIYVMIWNLDVCVCFFTRMAISKTVWKMVKDHRYFQFAKWMKEKRAKNTKAFSFAIMHTQTILQNVGKKQSERTNYECCSLSQGDQRERWKYYIYAWWFFSSFQLYLCGHFFTVVNASFLFLFHFSYDACSKTIPFLCRHATTSIPHDSRNWVVIFFSPLSHSKWRDRSHRRMHKKV